MLLTPDAIQRLITWFDQNPNCNDLITGPLLFDGMNRIATHYNPGWRSEMWGMWSQAYRAPSGEVVAPVELPDRMLGLIELPSGKRVSGVERQYILLDATPVGRPLPG